MNITYIKLFVDYLDAIEPLGDAERGRLFTALLEYARSGEAPQLGGNERFLFPMMRAQLDRDLEAFAAEEEDIHDKRSAAGKKGGKASAERRSKLKQSQTDVSKAKQSQANEAKASNRKQSQANEAKEKDKDKDEDNKGGGGGDARAREECELSEALPVQPRDASAGAETVYDADFGRVYSFYENRIGYKPSTVATAEMQLYVQELTADVVLHAMNLAIDKGKIQDWSYTKGILNRYKSQGLTTLGAVLQSERQYEESKAQRRERGGGASDSYANSGAATAPFRQEPRKSFLEMYLEGQET